MLFILHCLIVVACDTGYFADTTGTAKTILYPSTNDGPLLNGSAVGGKRMNRLALIVQIPVSDLNMSLNSWMQCLCDV